MNTIAADPREDGAETSEDRSGGCRPLRRLTVIGWRLAAAGVWVLAACTEPPSWQRLLTAKIMQQYPAYEVQPVPDGSVVVRRPGLADVPVDIDAIALFCRRGPKDCGYATDQMLLTLGAPKK